ncbi:MCE family protein [Nocardia sp. NPDC005978]|uniref:MCE family protein n=1 Tax=Nocardia sp. NPDC005978 TaxID=3156725 RepID=UPI0033A1B72C
MVAGAVGGAITLFEGGLDDTVPVTVLSSRAGLVMYPDAKVQMRGVTVGKVAEIHERADGMAVIRLAIDSGQLSKIPANVSVDIASTTVFGAKYVQFIAPEKPSTAALSAGQTFDADHVTVEINTIFQQLTQVLGKVEPEKLNATLGAIATATKGRGQRIGQLLTDLEAFLAQLEPALPALNTDLTQLPVVAAAYADGAPALVSTAADATAIGATLIDEQQNLDALLTGVIGLSDSGNQVLADNQDALASTLHLLVPTVQLTNEYREALRCGIEGLARLDRLPPAEAEGVMISANFLFGTFPYSYPESLPKVAAKGGPQCVGMPVPYDTHPPFVVADVGANPYARGQQGINFNSEWLQHLLFGTNGGK